MPTIPSGLQVELRRGAQRAVTVEVGGGLRSYDVDGLPVLAGYDVGERCTGARGQLLIPWPNRLEEGRWSWRGHQHQLPLDELSSRSAMHGLMRWRPWVLAERWETAARWKNTLFPQPGWPGTLACAVDHWLADAALHSRTTITNVGPSACPVAFGAHPYLAAAPGTLVDDGVLTIQAVVCQRLDGSVARIEVGEAWDFRGGRLLGPDELDVALGQLERDADGWAQIRFETTTATMLLELSANYRWLQLYTGDNDPHPARRRRSLALEPMTAPPGALASGRDLMVLEPGEQVAAEWRLQAALKGRPHGGLD